MALPLYFCVMPFASPRQLQGREQVPWAKSSWPSQRGKAGKSGQVEADKDRCGFAGGIDGPDHVEDLIAADWGR
jgi:hypothetical protein